MGLKRAIGFGAILWVLIFFEISMLMFGFGYDNSSKTYYLIHFILTAVFVIVLSLLYFKGLAVLNNTKGSKKTIKENKIKKGVFEGLYIGIVFVIVGIILDSIITVPLFVKPFSFFADTALIFSYMLTVILCIVVGWFNSVKK